MSVTQAAFSLREDFSAADAAIVEAVGVDDLAELLGVDLDELETAVFGGVKSKSGGVKTVVKKQSVLERLQSKLRPSRKQIEEKIAKINADIAEVDLRMAPLKAERERLSRMLIEWEAKRK